MRCGTALWAALFLFACGSSEDGGSASGGAAGSSGTGGSTGAAGGVGGTSSGTGGTSTGGTSTGGTSTGGTSTGGTSTGGTSTGGTSTGGASTGGTGTGGTGTGGTGTGGAPSTGPCKQVLSPGANVGTAANAAAAGDVICLHAGSYAGFTLTKSGAPNAPIVIKAYPGEEQQAKLTNGSSTSGYGIRIDNADYIIVESLWIDKVNQGIYVKDSDYVQVWNNKVTEVGQECLRFKQSDFGTFGGNTVKGCGRKVGANGEGIYVGSGETTGDDSHGVLVRGNDISDTTHEGIELKGFTYDCIVENNVVHDLTVVDGGAIHVGTNEGAANNESGHVVRGNVVYNVKTTTVYSDGNGINFHRGGQIYNNVLYGNQHYGIRVDDKKGLKGKVKVFHNTMWNNAKGALGLFDGIVPDVRNNIGPTSADNMAAAAELFEQASSGDFHLKAGSAAIDKGSDAGIAVDLEGTARPQGAGYDYGAYERK